ncbi:MAG: ABC transporter permease [Acidobacteria bacterium]|nr:ABC transporter permease [Acidobacteriota bacterium]
MKTGDLLELASRNLRESLLRNGLTTAGIAVGVASLLAMISLGVGLQELAGNRLSRSGLFDTVAVSPSRETLGRNRGEQRTDPEASEPRVLDEDARREIERLPNVVETQPEIRFLTEVHYGDRSHVASVGGLAPSARENEAFDNMQGIFFSSPAAREAIVRKEFARQLDEKSPPSVIGQDLILRYGERQPLPDSENAEGGRENQNAEEHYGFSVIRREEALRIVGIIDSEPFGGMRPTSRARVFIPTRLAEDLNILQASDVPGAVRTGSSKKTYATLMTRVSSPANVQAVEDSIRKMGFRTFSILDASQGLRRFFTVLDLLLGIFGSLALAVASLGIINTLVMAVLERRREIGILKAVGASDADVEKLFFAEAGAMGLMGGILGVLLGEALGAGINFGTGVYLRRHGLPPETVWSAPLWLVGSAIGFAVLVSLVSGLYPARRAAKLDPVQALRYE